MIRHLVSVIIPVYNAAKYLRECIDSLLNQTYTTIEIILIDDGSTDDSGDICDEYAAQHKSIRVVHQKNSGVSKARNVGLELMQGEFFTFVDGDDTIDPTFIELMVDEMCSNKVDLVRLSWRRGSVPKTYSAPFDENGRFFVGINNLNDLLWFANIWGLFRSCCLKNIRFDENLKYAEDSLFIFDYFIKSPTQRMILINKPFYHYRITENSATDIDVFERLKRCNMFLAKLDEIEFMGLDLNFLKDKYVYRNYLVLLYHFIDEKIDEKNGYTKSELEEKIRFLRKKGCRENTFSGIIISAIYRHHLHFILTIYRKLRNSL